MLRVGQALPDDVENGRHVAQRRRGWIEPETGENEAAEAAALVLPKPQVFTIAKHKPVKLSVEDAQTAYSRMPFRRYAWSFR